MKKEDTEEKDLLPILRVVFIVLLILCALLLSIFLLVWTARRTKPQQEDLQLSGGNKVEQESKKPGEDDYPESVEPDTTESPLPEEEPITGEVPNSTELPVTEGEFNSTEPSSTEEETDITEPSDAEEPEVFTPEEVVENTDMGMVFASVNEVVTAKNATNLRDMPSQGEDSVILVTLQNGQTITRIGISETGWSKLEYNGEICYAVSSLLTTDLTAKPQEEQEAPEDDGIKTVFAECNERVCPKIEVNLRTLPSVTNPESEVVVTIRHGDIVTRTGINTDVGWSRVQYGEQTLYCISSYVYVVEE